MKTAKQIYIAKVIYLLCCLNFVTFQVNARLAKTDVEKKELLTRLCSREEILDGKWENETLPKAPFNPYESQYDDWRKNPKYVCGEEEDYHKASWKTYKWVPNNSRTEAGKDQCRFEPFDKSQFCNVARRIGRMQQSPPRLAIIGDSLSWEHYQTLAFTLGLDIDIHGQDWSKENGKNIEQTGCDGDVDLAFRRTEHLEAVPDVLETFDPNIIVINKGAHIETDSEFAETLQNTISVLEEWQFSCKSKICWVFVRTTVPGHIKYDTFFEPDNDLEKMEKWINNRFNYNQKVVAYGWFKFKTENKIMLDMFEKSTVVHEVIDAYEINIRRPDLHRDWLHSCLPGKIEIYNQILLQYMKIKLLNFRQSNYKEKSLATS